MSPRLLLIAVIAPLAVAANGDYAQQVVELVNQERWYDGGLSPLKRNDLLDQSAHSHSTNMAERNFFSHCDLDTKTSPFDRMRAAGYNYRAAGENIAAGYGTPADVMNGWMNSSGHRSNILSGSYREIGVGYVFQSADHKNIRGDTNGDCAADYADRGPYYKYWTQNFGSSGAYPLVIDRENDETASPDVDLYVYGQGFAAQMRFRNEDGAWSMWEPYSPDMFWTLSPGAGVKTVSAQIRNGSDVRTATDSILLVQGCSAMNDDHHLHVQATTVSVDRTFSACNTLLAGAGGFRVEAKVTFHAPRILLRPGFSVAANGVFSAVSGVPK